MQAHEGKGPLWGISLMSGPLNQLLGKVALRSERSGVMTMLSKQKVPGVAALSYHTHP